MAYVCCRGDFIKFYQEEEREKKKRKGREIVAYLVHTIDYSSWLNFVREPTGTTKSARYQLGGDA
jgi:hypothetical protein